MQQPINNLKQQQSKPLNKSFRLPYLDINASRQKSNKISQSKIQKNFDLSMSNSKLPLYNPQKDRNLKYFFQKQANKRLINLTKLLQQNHSKSKPKLLHNNKITKNINSSNKLVPDIKTQQTQSTRTLKQKKKSTIKLQQYYQNNKNKERNKQRNKQKPRSSLLKSKKIQSLLQMIL